jgi:hypothetical protein
VLPQYNHNVYPNYTIYGLTHKEQVMIKSKYAIWLAAAAMLVGSLACNTLVGGQVDAEATVVVDFDDPTQEAAATEGSGQTVDEATPTPTSDTGGGETADTEFPMPDDAFNVSVISAEQLNFQTSMPLADVPDYYRAAFSAEGYTERELLTVISDAAISMVFDGHASGKAVVVQAIDLNGSTNVNVRLEAIP